MYLAARPGGGQVQGSYRRDRKRQGVESSPFGLAYLGYGYGASGDRTSAEATLQKLNQMASQRYVSPVAEAIIYIGLGDHERALDRLEQAYQTKSSMLF